jgi:cellulose synthase/poly-beta-1,6-N-acetylglucosamine synthase-like glycosyltransferase
MLSLIPLIIPIICLILLSVFSLIELSKKRVKLKEYFISFIVPSYNCSKTIKATIESIYNSYDKNKFELFVINDKSKDDSIRIMKDLKKKYGFTIIDNKKNLGKANSINNAFLKTKGELIFIVDADTVINKECINDIISRFNFNKKIGAVSCSCKAKGSGFLSFMQTIEYNIQSFIWYSHNLYSSNCLWGPCNAIKREAFENVKGFSENALSEDADMAFKLNKNKWKVEQGIFRAETEVPEDFNAWFKQKVRWTSGGVQCFMNYPDVFLKNPISLCIISCYTFLTILILMNIPSIINFYYGIFQTFFYLIKYTGFGVFSSLIQTTKDYEKELGMTLIYPVVFIASNIPYTVTFVKKLKDIYKILLVIPFSLVYLPLYYVAVGFGIVNGFNAYRKFKTGVRAW